MNKQETKEIAKWEVKIPVFRNPLLWRQLLIVSILSSGFVLVLLVGLNLFEYHWEEIPNSFLVWAVLAGGMFAAFAIILMFLSRGITTRYTVFENGVVQETLTSYGKIAAKASFLALLFGGAKGATAAGAGMLARSREMISAVWKDIYLVELYPSRKEIRLKNQWRTVMQIICLPENYQQVADTALASVSVEPMESEDSVFSKFVSTFLVVLLGIFLFPRLPIHVPGAFVILMIFFAFPAIWSTTLFRKVSAVIVLLALISGIFLAVWFGEVDFSRNGTAYAFAIQLMSFVSFAFVAIGAFFRRIGTGDKATVKGEE